MIDQDFSTVCFGMMTTTAIVLFLVAPLSWSSCSPWQLFPATNLTLVSLSFTRLLRHFPLKIDLIIQALLQTKCNLPDIIHPTFPKTFTISYHWSIIHIFNALYFMGFHLLANDIVPSFPTSGCRIGGCCYFFHEVRVLGW